MLITILFLRASGVFRLTRRRRRSLPVTYLQPELTREAVELRIGKVTRHQR